MNRIEIARLWSERSDRISLTFLWRERHRNLARFSAEFICSFAAGIGAKRIFEVGGSSGLSTIALAAAARQVSGRVTSIEKEPLRQAEARQTLSVLNSPHTSSIFG